MKRLRLLIIAVILILSGCNTLSPGVPVVRDMPSVNPKADPYIWDFGRVREGEVLTHDFVLSNETENTLVIKDVLSSCGCTVSEVGKKALLPHESTVIKVKFNTKGYLGLIQQFVYANTDNPEEPVVRFIVKAEVRK